MFQVALCARVWVYVCAYLIVWANMWVCVYFFIFISFSIFRVWLWVCCDKLTITSRANLIVTRYIEFLFFSTSSSSSWLQSWDLFHNIFLLSFLIQIYTYISPINGMQMSVCSVFHRKYCNTYIRCRIFRLPHTHLDHCYYFSIFFLFHLHFVLLFRLLKLFAIFIHRE